MHTKEQIVSGLWWRLLLLLLTRRLLLHLWWRALERVAESKEIGLLLLCIVARRRDRLLLRCTLRRRGLECSPIVTGRLLLRLRTWLLSL